MDTSLRAFLKNTNAEFWNVQIITVCIKDEASRDKKAVTAGSLSVDISTAGHHWVLATSNDYTTKTTFLFDSTASYYMPVKSMQGQSSYKKFIFLSH